MPNPEKLSADEIALYDRQIRLWGTETQLRLRSAKLLVVRLGGIGTETVKNLVLGGINSIEILDDAVVKEEDFATQFFLPNDESIIGKPKLPQVVVSIQELNTRVHLLINTRSLLEIDSEYLAQFDMVIATELSKSELLRMNDLTRELRLPLYVAGLHGMFGYILTDLIEHTSVKEYEKGSHSRAANSAINGVKTVTAVEPLENGARERVTVVDRYTPLADIFSSTKLPAQLTRRQLKRLSGALPLVLALFEVSRPVKSSTSVDLEQLRDIASRVCRQLQVAESAVSEQYLQEFARQAFTEFAPVAAIVGGSLAQDVIQYFGQKDSPINNCMIFDGSSAEMPVYYL